jgi:hypothetical protein
MASEFRLAHFFKPISSLFGADRLNDPENLGKVLKNSPLLPYEGKLFALHPAQSCGLSAYFLSLTRAVSGYIPSVSCSDAGSTPSVREATQAGVLARGNMPTMILCPESGVKIAISALDRLQSVSFAQDAVGQIL